MPFRRPFRIALHFVCAAACLAFPVSSALAGVAAPASSAFALRPVLLASAEGTPTPTSALAMGGTPKKSKRMWLYVGLAALAVGGAVAFAGGGDSAPSTPVAPIDPPPPPPPASAHGGAR